MIQEEQSFLNIRQFVWQVIKPYGWWYFLVLQATIIGGSYIFINSYSIKLLVDAFSIDAPIEYSNLMLPIGLFIFAQVGNDLLWRISDFANSRSTPFIHKAIMLKSYNYVQYHSYDYFQNYSSGTIISKLKGILEGFERIFENIHYRAGLNFITMMSCVFSLLIVDTSVFLFMFLWVGIAMGVMYPICNMLNKLSDNLAESKHNVMGVFSDNIVNIYSLFYFAKRRSELASISDKISKQYIPHAVKFERSFFTLSLISNILYWFMLIFVFLFMIWLRKIGRISTGDFVFVMMTVLTITAELWTFTENVYELMKELGNFKASFSILNRPHDNVDKSSSRSFEILSTAIEFKDLTFQYESGNIIFDHLNLLIPAGQKIGIVGQSGAGKSTLISLLLKNFLPTKGQIIIDGHSIEDFNSDSIRSQIALIPQDIVLFHRTIGENIGYAKENATMDEIKLAAHFANIDTFIDSLPEKYDTFVGERGIKLSGGQRQRIAIARGFLKNASVTILDEATSSLDTATEQEIQKAIDKILSQKNTTVITIAHRLSSIRRMDRIVVMDGGKIIEDGSFDELLSKESGYFKKLWDNQVNGMVV